MNNLLQQVPNNLKPPETMINCWIDYLETLTAGSMVDINLGKRSETIHISAIKEVRAIQARALAQAQWLLENKEIVKTITDKEKIQDEGPTRLELEQKASTNLVGASSIYANIALYGAETKNTQAIGHMRSLTNQTPPSFILLLGNVGCGKTFASVAYVASKCDSNGKINAQFITAYEISVALDQKNHDLLNKIIAKQWLILDDVGVLNNETFRNKAFCEFLEHLINQRYEHNRKTIITSNLNADQFKVSYGERIWSRIKSSGKCFELSSDDLRNKI